MMAWAWNAFLFLNIFLSKEMVQKGGGCAKGANIYEVHALLHFVSKKRSNVNLFLAYLVTFL